MVELFPALPLWVAGLFILIFCGVPIAFALGTVGVVSLYLGLGPQMAPAMAYVTWDGMANYTMATIPLFIFMGYLVFESGLSNRMYGGVEPLLDRLLPGGLLHTNIVVGAIFAASSGSSIATSATIGSIAIPEMEKRGYSRGIAAGSTAAGGCLGILIPPSIVFVFYGLLVNVSIGKLFLAGIIPGIILSLTFMAYIALRVRLQPQLVAGGRELKEKPSWRFALVSMLKVWPAMVFIVAVMGSMYSGLATATEAAGLGSVSALILAAGHRLLSWDVLKRATIGALKVSCMVLCLMFGGRLVQIFLSNSGLASQLASHVVGLQLHPLAVMGFLVIMYIFIGMVMDTFTMMVLTLPIIFPIILALGFDSIWFGVIMTMLNECGMMTPPVGTHLFVLQGLRPDYPFELIVRGVAPFFFCILAVIALIIAFPALATTLPNMIITR